MAHITVQQLGQGDINTTKTVIMVSVAGDFDQASIEQDAGNIKTLVDKAVPGTILLFDLSNLMYMNSRSISYLVNWYMDMERRDSKLCLYALRPNIFDILETTGITNVIPIFTNFDEAKLAIEMDKIKLGEHKAELEVSGPEIPVAVPAPIQQPQVQAAPAATPAPVLPVQPQIPQNPNDFGIARPNPVQEIPVIQQSTTPSATTEEVPLTFSIDRGAEPAAIPTPAPVAAQPVVPAAPVPPTPVAPAPVAQAPAVVLPPTLVQPETPAAPAAPATTFSIMED